MVEETAYDATQIQVLEGLQAIRKRPAMYIGSVDARGLHHLVHEVVDNSIDEAMAGFCKEIQVTLNADGSVTVADDGRGIPVDIHPKYGAPGVEIVLSRMHSGGKFERKMYRVSGGLHGVGLSVVNGLSEWLEVRVKRDGQEHRMRFERGKKATDLEVVGPAEGTGTIIPSFRIRRSSNPSNSIMTSWRRAYGSWRSSTPAFGSSSWTRSTIAGTSSNFRVASPSTSNGSTGRRTRCIRIQSGSQKNPTVRSSKSRCTTA